MFHHRDKARKDPGASEAPEHERAEDQELSRSEEIDIQRRLQLEVETFEQGIEG